MRVPALIRQYIEVDIEDLPRQVYAQMISALTVENPEKQTAMREKLWGAEEMPDSILLLYQHGHRLYIPRGFIHSFINGMRAYGVEIEWNDQRRVYDYFDLGLQSTVQLRGYQEPMCDALVAGECGIVAAETGAGKSEVVLAAISKISQPSIIIVEKATLAEQWRERIRSRLGIEPGYIGENKFELAPITLALRQTLWARVDELSSMATMVAPLSPRRLFFDLWGCVVTDECFPAGTMVGDQPIESIAVGDMVDTFAEDVGLSKEVVIHRFKRRPSQLVRLHLDDGRELVCTPEHPILTPEGWMPARAIGGRMVLAYDHGSPKEIAPARKGYDELLLVRDGVRVDQEDATRLFTQNRTSVLHLGLLVQGAASSIINHDGCDQSQICVGSHETQEPDARPCGAVAAIENFDRDGAQAAGAGREREADSASSAIVIRGSWVALRGSGSHRQASGSGAANLLQDRYRECRAEDCDRSRRGVAQCTNTARSGSTQERVLGWTRVDCVEVLQPGSDGRFGGLCPDGFVYNLEVERNHTYFANDVVVHNCHHVAAATVTDIVQRFSARYRWGVSATPERDPLTFPITQVVVGPVLYETPPEALVGALMTPKIQVLTSSFDFDYHPTTIVDKTDEETGEAIFSARTGKPIQKRVQNNYSDMLRALCTDPDRNDMIARKVVEEASAGHHALIISRRKEQLEALKQAIYVHADVDLPVLELFGKEPGSRKLEVEERINASERSILLSTVAEEGLDIPKLDRCVLAYPFRNVEVVRQPIGRILRKHPAKTDAIVIDIRDRAVGLLASQYRERAQMLYGKRGWEIEHV